MKWKGRVTFTTFKIDTDEAEKLQDFLARAENVEPSVFEKAFNRLKDICEVREVAYDNLIVAAGRSVFARLLAGDDTFSGEVNYGAVGTDDTTVTDGDTELGAEIARKGIATRSRTGTTVLLRFFFGKTDFDDTAEEFGTFIDGTGSADSGEMFNRVLTGGWAKSDLEALTVTVQFDLNPQS